MPLWHGKSKGNRLGYSIFVSVLRNLGIAPAYFLLRFVSLYYFLFSWKTNRSMYRYFNRYLGFHPIKSCLKIYKNYYLFGQTLIDKVVIFSGIPNRFTFEFDGEEHLSKMAAEGRGGLLLSAHIGNWDVAGAMLQRLSTRIHIVMFDGEDRRIKEYMDSVTGENTARIITIRDDLSHIYAIDEALRNNELVCIHADRYLENTKTLEASLLGANAQFPAGPFILAERKKVPVSFVFAMKESAYHYHLYASPALQIGTGERNAAIRSLLDHFTKDMEAKIKAYPEQWFNYYEFWSN